MPDVRFVPIAFACLVLASSGLGAGHARAQTTSGAAAISYPEKPVRVIIAFAPGGGVDILARAVSLKLGETLGRPFIVENRPGAGGTTAYAFAAKAAPDGYNLLAVSGAYAMSAALYRNLPYDAVRDFAPIAQMGAAPFLIVVHPSLPVKNVKDLVALAKARPGELNFASGGIGSSGHLTGELFKYVAGINMTYIPYKGGDLALVDLISGQVHVVVSNLLSSLPHVRSGRLRAIAVTSLQRHSALPDVPTVDASGLAGFEAVNWYGWLAPAATPLAIVQKLNAEIGSVVRQPEVQQQFARDGAEPAWSTPAQFGERIVREVARWRKIVAAAGLQVQ